MDGLYNTAVGAAALDLNTGDENTAVGTGALLLNSSGTINTANGAFALLFNTTGFANTAIGYQAIFNNPTGIYNTAIGDRALLNDIGEGGNTAVGERALSSATTGVGNIAVGMLAGGNVTTASNVICLWSSGVNVSNSCFINQVRGVTTTQNNALPVLIDANGQMGTQSSSVRFKKEIKTMEKASESILSLRPVTFHYKSDKTNRPEFGLIAEEVAKTNPDLVVRDAAGEIYTVRYDAVNAMLLNEFLKEHRKNEQQESKIEQQETKIARQEKQIEELTAGLQKVSAQLEVNKPGPQTVKNSD